MSDPGSEPGKHHKANAVLEQMGGISGLIYSSLPVIVFVPISSLLGLMPAIGAALGVAALILVWRLIRRESAQPAISGFIGVGISALIAYIVGESKGYFLLKDGKMVANEGDLIFTTKKGIRYTLRFGEIVFGEGDAVTSGKEDAKPAKPKDGAPLYVGQQVDIYIDATAGQR